MDRIIGSKALAAEVRILLQEVGKLRDEKRALQYEVSELLAAKARYGGDGEYHPEWRPQQPPPMAIPAPEPEPPSDALVLHQEAKSGWHKVSKKPERKPREPRKKAPAPEPTPAPPVQIPPQPNLPSWASWKPNPIYHPQPRSSAPVGPPPGLFGTPP
ncbi:hypothetical protein CPB86DRAFT_312621 [Serendipita vermifera]|nr:hypothetical protein CPB86DRAFT_312621 [Serendipita vermifera]